MAAPLEGFDFAALRQALADLGADGWLLCDFRGVNPVAPQVLGLHGMATRRMFVLLPRDGAPVALAHKIELGPFADFPGEVRPYAAWRELHAGLRALVAGETPALWGATHRNVPDLDRGPGGVGHAP